MFLPAQSVWTQNTKKEQRFKEALEKLDRAEIIARGLGIAHHEIARLKEEGLRELNRQLFS